MRSLSKDLRKEFLGFAGFSLQNVWYMRQFYLEYSGHERLQPLVGEIAGAHNLILSIFRNWVTNTAKGIWNGP